MSISFQTPFHGSPEKGEIYLADGPTIHHVIRLDDIGLSSQGMPDTITIEGTIWRYAGVMDGIGYYSRDDFTEVERIEP